MDSLLQQFVVDQVIIYMLVFCRVGTTIMIMPGIGDGFVPTNVRLLFALAFAVILAPVTAPYLPNLDGISGSILIWYVITEVLIGFFIGTIARIFLAALDVAGMLISMNVGLGSAMMFNPQMAGQGSLIGAFLSITGALLLFVTDLHHMLIFGMVESYQTFPVGDAMPMVGGMAYTVVLAISKSFAIGFYMAVPFITISLFLYIAMGVLGRLMPQIQVFVLALPVQITLGMIVLSLTFSSIMLFWLNHYDNAIQIFFRDMG